MHQRHVVRASGEGGDTNGCDDGCCHHPHDDAGGAAGAGAMYVMDEAVKAADPSSKTGKFRKRRKKQQYNSKQILGILDEDWTIALIQIVSVCILIGCGIILFREKPGSGLFIPQDGPHQQPSQRYPKRPLPPSSYYTIPDSMPHLGDKSDHYALLRKEFDAIEDELQLQIPKLKTNVYEPLPMQATNTNSYDQVPYDIYNCPDMPPHGYPFDWILLDVLAHWPVDDPTPRPQVYQGLCVFDFTKDYQKAMNYREKEVPFVVSNDPQVQKAVARWNSPNYMQRMLGAVMHRTEMSENNHFMYWNQPPKNKNMKRPKNLPKKSLRPWQRIMETPENWTQPTKQMRMTYDDWLDHANVTDDFLGPDQPHWYFRLIGCGETGPQGECDAGSSEYLYDELTFFQPKPSLYMVDPNQQKGIHCRFGMKGVIAENHFDGSRNSIAVLGGERRYILSHPNQCDFLSLWPKGHPSARHSAVDWSTPDLDKHPEFAMAKGNEVVLKPGDVLYLPTNWFHYIISLSLNFQCNTRSGISQDYMQPIHQCGF